MPRKSTKPEPTSKSRQRKEGGGRKREFESGMQKKVYLEASDWAALEAVAALKGQKVSALARQVLLDYLNSDETRLLVSEARDILSDGG